MTALTESDLRFFVDTVRRYFSVTTGQDPEITSAFLAMDAIDANEYNGIVSFSGDYTGQVMVSMPAAMLRELLILQHERNLSEANLLDAVGEIANTLAGNARQAFGSGLDISVPVKLHGHSGIKARVRKHPYVITLRWGHHTALVCVDMER
jgi:chemotaxis protein CheX